MITDLKGQLRFHIIRSCHVQYGENFFQIFSYSSSNDGGSTTASPTTTRPKAALAGE